MRSPRYSAQEQSNRSRAEGDGMVTRRFYESIEGGKG